MLHFCKITIVDVISLLNHPKSDFQSNKESGDLYLRQGVVRLVYILGCDSRSPCPWRHNFSSYRDDKSYGGRVVENGSSNEPGETGFYHRQDGQRGVK